MECEFCHSKFSSRGNLAVHQKSAKYCLILQGKEEVTHECQYCQRSYNRTDVRDQHEGVCGAADLERKHLLYKRRAKLLEKDKKKRQQEIACLREELSALQEELTQSHERLAREKTKTEDLEKELALLRVEIAEKKGGLDAYERLTIRSSKATGSSSSSSSSSHPKLSGLSTEKVGSLEIETIEQHIADGEYNYEMFSTLPHAGIPQFLLRIIEYPREDGTMERNYVCTDSARYKCFRFTSSGEWEIDTGAKFLNEYLDKMHDPIHDFFKTLIDIRRSHHQSERAKANAKLICQRVAQAYQGICFPDSKGRREFFHIIRGVICKDVSI